MTDINNINTTPDRASFNGAARVTEPRAGVRLNGALASSRTAAEVDRVEISEQSRLLSQLRALPEVRADLVERVRGEIAADTYLTEDKVDGSLLDLGADLDALG